MVIYSCVKNVHRQSAMLFNFNIWVLSVFPNNLLTGWTLFIAGGLKHRKQPDVVCDDLLVKLAWNEATLPLLLYTQPPNLRLLHAWQITSNCAFLFFLPPNLLLLHWTYFHPKSIIYCAKYYRVLLWDSFVCACQKIGNQILVFKVTKIGIALQFKYFPPLKKSVIFTP